MPDSRTPDERDHVAGKLNPDAKPEAVDDPYEDVPEFEPDPEHVDDDSEELPNPPDPKTGRRE